MTARPNKDSMQPNFWIDKRVLITGHTGFKGSWLCLLLHSLGAQVTGYALQPPTEPSLFRLCKIDTLIHRSIFGDVLDGHALHTAIREAQPEIIIHMAAQSLVRMSYEQPVATYATNIMGTVNLLDAVRQNTGVRAIINVTSDKCYANNEWVWGYRENDQLGGRDPYASSKACSELITAAYTSSFFPPETYTAHGVAVASVRAGNVIGGGDWAKDRLIVDCITALLAGETIVIRNPQAIRPWQHVLEPLSGYLALGEHLYMHGKAFNGGWNFGPRDSDAKPVQWIVAQLCQKWGAAAEFTVAVGAQPHEAGCLKLDCSKAASHLHWHPKWSLDKTLDSIVVWYGDYAAGRDLRMRCLRQIGEYLEDQHL